MAKVCIVCYQEKSGTPVLDDAVIRAIRAAKQRLNMAKGNMLVVCEGCMEQYRKKRAKYERDLVMHVVLAGIVLLVFVLAPVFTTGFSITAVVLGLVLSALIVGLSVFSHCPAIEGGIGGNQPGRGEERKKKGKKK